MSIGCKLAVNIHCVKKPLTNEMNFSGWASTIEIVLPYLASRWLWPDFHPRLEICGKLLLLLPISVENCPPFLEGWPMKNGCTFSTMTAAVFSSQCSQGAALGTHFFLGLCIIYVVLGVIGGCKDSFALKFEKCLLEASDLMGVQSCLKYYNK